MFMPPVFPAHWHVSQPVLIADTFSSLVWKVSLPDGTPAIVKGLKPIEDIADELRGADYLVWRNGRGAVRLLGRENNLMLLEYAGERMLSHIVAEHGDYQATEIAAELMAKLYAASEEPLPSALLPIRDRFAAHIGLSLFFVVGWENSRHCPFHYVQWHCIHCPDPSPVHPELSHPKRLSYSINHHTWSCRARHVWRRGRRHARACRSGRRWKSS